MERTSLITYSSYYLLSHNGLVIVIMLKLLEILVFGQFADLHQTICRNSERIGGVASLPTSGSPTSSDFSTDIPPWLASRTV